MFTAPIPVVEQTERHRSGLIPRASKNNSPAQRPRRWWALVVLMLPVLLVSIDNTVLSFALPSISEALKPSGNQMLWVVDVYPLVLAGLLVTMGSLGDRIGRRRLLLIGGTGFTLVSTAAAFAPSGAWLIAARATLGIFGSMLMPATLSLIRNIFPDPRERRTAIAVWASGFSGGAALGPILGGFLLDHFAWGSVFLMAVPVMLPLLVLGPLVVPESRDPAPGPIDPLSIVLVLATMLPLVWSIKVFSVEGFSPVVVIALVLALACGVWFVRRQLHRPTPMLDVALFTNPVFTGAILANLLSIFALVGFLYFVSQHLQLVSGYSPMQAGIMLIPGLAVTVAAGFAVVPLVRKFRPGHVVAGGLLLNALGFLAVAFAGPMDSDLGLMVGFAVLGAGGGAAETISNDLILSAVPSEQAGAASAISETAYETGSVLGTAVLGSVLNAAYRAQVSLPAGLPQEQKAAAQETLGGATDVARTLEPEAAARLLDSARHAFDAGVAWTGGIGVVLMLAAMVMALRTLRHAEG